MGFVCFNYDEKKKKIHQKKKKNFVNVLYSVNKRAHEGQLDWATCLVNTMRSTVRVLTQLIYGSCGQGCVSRVYPIRMGHEMTLP